MQEINYLKLLFIVGILPGMLVGCTTANKHYAEIATPDTPYIAMIRTERANSSKVIYNSDICKQIGEACGFFRSQAYAHKVLNHQYLPPDKYPDSQEHAADCWAAQHAEPGEVAAAIRLLSEMENYPGIPITGNPETRAERIRNCANL